MKKFMLFFLMMFFLTTKLFAQKTVTDSAKLKTKIAVADAKHFKLNKQNRKKYKKHEIGYTSDYFKPNIINSAHPEWFTDSVYVKAFREVAYQKTVKTRTVGHYILVGGGIYVGAAVVGTIVMVVGLSTGFIKL